MNLRQEDWADQQANDTNAIVLDVRTAEEFSEGFISNAINIDIHQGQGFIYKLEELDKSKNYYVYCRSGARSAKACEIMNELGFNAAYNLLGGILDWDGEVVTNE
jgi:rhodanese-related sulfurtransferase